MLNTNKSSTLLHNLTAKDVLESASNLPAIPVS